MTLVGRQLWPVIRKPTAGFIIPSAQLVYIADLLALQGERARKISNFILAGRKQSRPVTGLAVAAGQTSLRWLRFAPQ
jgi:Na+/proline symporter